MPRHLIANRHFPQKEWSKGCKQSIFQDLSDDPGAVAASWLRLFAVSLPIKPVEGPCSCFKKAMFICFALTANGMMWHTSGWAVFVKTQTLPSLARHYFQRSVSRNERFSGGRLGLWACALLREKEKGKLCVFLWKWRMGHTFSRSLAFRWTLAELLTDAEADTWDVPPLPAWLSRSFPCITR